MPDFTARRALTVHHLNTYLRGGAAGAAIGLHTALQQMGVSSRMWHADHEQSVNSKQVTGLESIQWQKTKRPLPAECLARVAALIRRRHFKWARRRALRGRDARCEIFTAAPQLGTTECTQDFLAADIVHLHWVSQLIEYKSFFASIPRSFPIVWTLHDMNPFTGGCHFSNGCDRFVEGCGNCPQLGRSGASDLSRQTFSNKTESSHHRNLHVVAPSKWLAEEARRSPIFAQASTIRTIPYGLDVDAYAACDRRTARQSHGLPEDAFVIGFGADDLRNPRKGMLELTAAIGALQPSEQVVGLSFGKGTPPRALTEAMRVREAGFVSDRRKLSQVYSAMDLFVLPSMEDNLPQTGLEAMACGIPVVAFDVGGIPDFVRPGETGHLATASQPTTLTLILQELLEKPDECRRMGSRARKLIEQQFNSVHTANAYVDFYRELIAGQRSLKVA